MWLVAIRMGSTGIKFLHAMYKTLHTLCLASLSSSIVRSYYLSPYASKYFRVLEFCPKRGDFLEYWDFFLIWGETVDGVRQSSGLDSHSLKISLVSVSEWMGGSGGHRFLWLSRETVLKYRVKKCWLLYKAGALGDTDKSFIDDSLD